MNEFGAYRELPDEERDDTIYNWWSGDVAFPGAFLLCWLLGGHPVIAGTYTCARCGLTWEMDEP